MALTVCTGTDWQPGLKFCPKNDQTHFVPGLMDTGRKDGDGRFGPWEHDDCS